MFCTKCGTQVNDTAVFCPICGNRLKNEQPYPQPNSGQYIPPVYGNAPNSGNAMPDGGQFNTATPPYSPLREKTLAMFQDKKFFYMCVLFTVYGVTGIIAGGTIDIPGILMTIFLWLIYSSAQKGKLNVGEMRHVSGVLYANFVITIVAVVLLCICVVILICVSAPPVGMFYNSGIGNEVLGDKFIYEFAKEFGSVPYLLALTAYIPIAALITGAVIFLTVSIVLGIITTKTLHSFAKSLYRHMYNPEVKVVKAKEAKFWLTVQLVLNAASSLIVIGASLMFVVNAAAGIAVVVIVIKLMGEYFEV